MTKQRYGTGSMVERKPGSNVWRLRAYVRETGRQQQITFHGDSKAAGKRLAKFITEVEEGRFDHTKATVGELLDKWIEQIETTRRPSTLQGYRNKISHAIKPALEDIALAKLRPDQLDRFYREQLDSGLSTATVRQFHAIISAACHQAVKWGWLTANPAERSSPPTAHNPEMEVPTLDEIDRLYKLARDTDPMMGTVIALAALTGARRGELCALRFSDIDLTIGRVTISRSLTVADGVTYEGPTKTHQRRAIALDKVGIAVLQDRMTAIVDLSEKAGSPLVDDPFVFSNQAHAGTPVSPDTLSHKFAALAKTAKVSCHLHSLRHFSVTTLIAAGVDVRTVSERAGHASAVMTLNRYSHALPERDRAAAGVLGRALTPKPATKRAKKIA